MLDTLKTKSNETYCDSLVRAYSLEILKEKSKIQALNHCQNAIELDQSENWRRFMYEVKSYITVHG